MKYQVGCLNHLTNDDEKFDSQDDAEEQALIECKDESAWGVWELEEDTGHATLLCIAYEDTLFYP